MDLHAAHERRRHVRIPIKLDARLQLLPPEATSAPHSFPAIAMDLSMSGMKLVTAHCPPEVYAQLLKTIRLARIECTLPGSEKAIEFRGRIVWVSRDNQTSRTQLNLGVSFDILSSEQHQALTRCSEAVRKSLVTTSAIKPVTPIPRPQNPSRP